MREINLLLINDANKFRDQDFQDHQNYLELKIFQIKNPMGFFGTIDFQSSMMLAISFYKIL